MPEVAKKTAVVVGGTKGIGRAVAQLLVEDGVAVTIVGRRADTGRAAADEIGAHFDQADVSDLGQVRALAERLIERQEQVHYLVQTADVLKAKRVTTAEGFELGFATNYLSRFLLVGLLLDQLRAGSARILHVAAAGASATFSLKSVPPGPRVGAFRAHGAGQGANDLFGLELADRLAGTGVGVQVANPGAVRTGIRDEVATTAAGKVLLGVFGALMTVRSPEESASLLLGAADRHPEEVLIGSTGAPIKVPGRARNPELRRALWARTEELVSHHLPSPARR